MRMNKEDTARMLAEEHYKGPSDIRAIYRLRARDEDREDEPVKLLEVTDETIPVGLEPVYFGSDPANGISYSVIIVEITPAEFDDPDIQKKLREEFGWTKEPVYPRPEVIKTT